MSSSISTPYSHLNVADPLSGIIDGLLQGHQIAQQFHRQRLEDQAFKTNQALHEQQMTMQDIMNRQLLQESARPVSDAGTVTNPAVEGGASPLSGVLGVDMGSNPGMPSYERKPDSSRTVKYGGRQYELKTPEEQQQAQLTRQIGANNTLEQAKTDADFQRQQMIRRNTLKLEGGGTPAQGLESIGIAAGTPLTRAEYAQGVETVQKLRRANFEKVGPNEGLYDLSGRGGAAPSGRAQAPAADPLGVATPWRPAVEAQGPPAPGQNGVFVTPDTADAQPASSAAPPAAAPGVPLLVASGVDKAGEDRKSREQLAADRNAAANARAASRNATTIQAAGIRRDTPTPGQEGVANRFDQRRRDAADNAMAAVQAKEDEVHAERTLIGEQLKDPNLPEAQRQTKLAQLKSAAFQVQAYQTRKATIRGAQLPPKAIQDKIPEGQDATSPDGHVWHKQGGIVYFVK